MKKTKPEPRPPDAKKRRPRQTMLRINELLIHLKERDLLEAYCEDFYTDKDWNTLHLIYRTFRVPHWRDKRLTYRRWVEEITVIRTSKDAYLVLDCGQRSREPLRNATETADYIAKLLRNHSREKDKDASI